MFVKSPFWDATIRNTIFIQFAILFIALIKIWGEDGFGNITLGNFIYSLAITVPLSFITGLLVVVYESRKFKNDV